MTGQHRRLTRRTLRAEGLLGLAAVIWGFAFVAQRVGMDHLGPFTYNGLRFALGAVSLLPLVGWLAKRSARVVGVAPPDRPGRRPPTVREALVVGLVLFGGASLQQVGLVFTTAGKAGFITGLYVIFVPMLGAFVGLVPTRAAGVGATIALGGLYLLSVRDGLRFAPGDLPVLVGALFWAVHVLLIARLSSAVDALRLAVAQFAVCSVASLAIGLVFEPWSLAAVAAAAVPIAYGGLLSVGVAYTLQVVAQRDVPPTHAAIILSFETVFAAVGGWLLLDETLDARAFAGCALMLVGIVTAQLGGAEARPSA